MPRLLVRLPNWIGDTVMALPSLAALHEAGFELQLVGKGWARSLLEALPYTVHAYPQGLMKRAAALRQVASGETHGAASNTAGKSPAPILLMTNSLSSALEARLAGLAACGFRHEGRSLLLSQPLAQNLQIHQVGRFWLLAQAMAALAPRPGPLQQAVPQHLHLPLSDSALTRAGELVATFDAPYLMLCPFGAGTIKGQSKLWTGFAELISEARKDQRFARLHWVICPGKGEVPDPALQALFDEDLAVAGRACHLHLFQNVGLPEYAALMKGAACTVGNDSGPSHMAAAVGAAQVTVFGPSDPAETRPWRPGAVYLGGLGHWPSVGDVLAALDKAIVLPA